MAHVTGYILDTNILLELARGNERGQRIAAEFDLQRTPANSMVSAVTVGEMIALARKFGWGSSKRDRLRKMLDQLVRIGIDRWEVLEAYGEIDQFSRSAGVAMGQNDIWIAATAKATGATLLTTDRDFDHLHGIHLTRIWFEPDTRKRL